MRKEVYNKKNYRRQPGSMINIVQAEQNNKKNALNLKVNEDTATRIELQSKIRKLVSDGLNEEEIIQTLNQNEKYTKYKMYFEGWIEHAMKKTNKEQKER